VRVTVFLVAAALFGVALRRRPASVRHLVWSSALAGALILPLVSAAFPRWTVPVWKDLVPAQGVALFSVDAKGSLLAATEPRAALPVPSASAPTRPGTLAGGVDWRVVTLAVWLLGVLAVVLRTVLGGVTVMRLSRRALPARAEVTSMVLQIRLQMGNCTEPRVLETEDATTPMTWGIFHPVILLPAAVAGGDEGRLRAVLLHEMAHVARRDYLLHLLGQAACALYWFHPLVWLSRREALRLRERASDDVVLGLGVRPSDYASSLVHLSRSLTAPRLCASLGITRCSNLENRVQAILDPRLRRGRLTAGAVLVTFVLASALVSVVGSLQPALAEIPALPLPAPLRAALPAFALTPSPAPAIQAAIPGSDLATVEAQAAAAAKAYNFELALSLYLKAAEMTKAIASDNSPQYAAALTRLGALCRSWDRWDQAHGYYSQALAILERVFGPTYTGLAEPLSFLAMEAEINKDLPQAESLYQRVLDLHQSPPGRETALAMMSKARVLRGLGRDGEASAVEQEVQASQVSATITAPISANPDASGVHRVGAGVSTPVLIYKMEPGYSREARLMKFQGAVALMIVVGVDGIPGDISVVRSLGFGLDEKAVEAVRQWRFKPGTKDGVPVRVSAQIEVNFRLL